jgi:hypothetical protein
MRSLIFIICLVGAHDQLSAQTLWQPSPGHTQIRIWPGPAPNQSLVYYIALKNARVPVEMRLYAQGGNAGLRA